MTFDWFHRFSPTAALTVAFGLVSVCGYSAAVAQTPAAKPPVVVGTNPGFSQQIEHPISPRLTPPSHSARKPQTPFERIVEPHLQQWMKQTPITRSAGLRARAQSVGGTSVNFPAFVTAPNLLINNGDQNPAWSSVTADFNNDGKPDVATIQQDGTVNVILNPGSFAKIASVTPIAPNTSDNANGPDIAWATAADLNGDGYPDLIAQDVANNQIVVWLGKGDGTLASAVPYNVAPKSGATWLGGGGIVVGDFNGDGFPDVATLEALETFSAPYPSTITEQTFINDGTGKLLAGAETDTIFNDYYAIGLDMLDVVSNDGHTISGIVAAVLDGAFNGSESSVGISIITMASNGDGSFASPTEPAGPLVPNYNLTMDSSFWATNLTANFNSASGNSKNRAAKIRSASTLGTGIPTTDIVFATGDGAVYDAPYSGGNPTSVNTLAGVNNELQFLGQAPGGSAPSSSGPPSLTQYPFQGQTVLNVADADGDGYQDVLLYVNGSLYILPNGGGGAFSSLPIQLAGGTGGDQQPLPADFDGTGNLSIVWVDALLDQVGYYQSMNGHQGGTGANGQFFAAPLVSGVNSSTNFVDLGNNLVVQTVGDFNGDGLLDVIAYDWSDYDGSDSQGNPAIVMGINQGTVPGKNETNNFKFTTIISAAAMAALPGSNSWGVNGLGFFDTVPVVSPQGTSVLIASDGGLYIAPIHPDGSPTTPVALNMGTTPIQCWTAYADVGDINGDGIPDIVVPYEGDGTCGISGPTGSGYFTLIGNADGTFQTATFTSFGGGLLMAKLINLSGQSGKLDLVLLDQDYGNYSFNTDVLKSNGDGTFDYQNPINVAPGYVSSAIIPGDFNADGKQDITLALHGQYDPSTEGIVPNTPGVLFIPNQGNYTFGTPSLANIGSWPVWGAYADFNGDGQPDLALINYASQTSNYVPAVEVFPNLGGGNFGPSIGFMDSFFANNHTASPSYIFTGNFGNSGGQDFLAATGFNTAEFINQGVTTLALAATPSSVGQGASVALTATVTSTLGGAAPTGTVSFSVGSVSLGSAPLDGATATLTTTELAVGTDTVTATYSGDSAHNTSTAVTAVTVTAAAPAITMTATPSSLSLVPGATGTVVLNLAANGTFSGAISFACAGAPSESSCTVSPSTLTLGANQTGTITVVIATTAKNNQYQASNRTGWKAAAGGVSLAGLLLLVLPRRSRVQRVFGVVVLSLLSIGSFALLTGCGGSGNKYTGTPAGTSNISVTATSGSVTASQTIALTITQPQAQ